MPKNTIMLPVGHEWIDAKSPFFAQVFCFQCDKCNAQFSYDMECGEEVFDDGDGSCDEE